MTQEEVQMAKSCAFSKVLYTVPLHSKYARALTFANLCQVRMITSRGNARHLHMRAPPDTPTHSVTLPARFGCVYVGLQCAPQQLRIPLASMLP